MELKTGGLLSVGCLVLALWLSLEASYACNEAVCASIVSKCTLTKSCKCELKNCTCCKECFDCLNYLYSECCSCVELCPKPNNTHHVLTQSQVGDLKDAMPDLFNILTEEVDLQARWSTFTFPVDIDQSWFQPKPSGDTSNTAYTIADGKILIDSSRDIVTVNCTVAYMSTCMPLNKCKNSCHSMGANYFRWFHTGCCECIGRTCINYGIDESRCLNCSVDDEMEDTGGEGDSEVEAQEKVTEVSEEGETPSQAQ